MSRILINRALLSYGNYLPYHPGKWRVVETVIKVCGLERLYRGQRFEVERQGIKWVLEPDCSIQRAVYYFSVFEIEETRFIQGHLGQDQVFLDIGANFGYYSMLASKLGAVVYAFEPVRHNYEILQKNSRLNSFERLNAFRLAFSDEEGEMDFLIPPSSCSGVGRLATSKGDHPELRHEVVSVTTLDRFVEQQQITRVDIIKIDVEGAEAKVLRGGRRTIDLFHPTMMIEFFPAGLQALRSSAQELLELIRSFGYKTYTINLQPFSDTRIEDHVNVVCLHAPGENTSVL